MESTKINESTGVTGYFQKKSMTRNLLQFLVFCNPCFENGFEFN